MHAIDTPHSPTPEELMEYLDGEGTPVSRERIAAHLAGCPTCQRLASDQRELTQDVQGWTVGALPASLQLPAAAPPPLSFPRWHWRSHTAMVTVSALAAGIMLIVMVTPALKTKLPAPPAQTRQTAFDPRAGRSGQVRVAGRIAGNPAPSGAPAPVLDKLSTAATEAVDVEPQSAPPNRPAVIRTASLRIVARDFSNARQSIESIVSAADGFIDQMSVTGDAASARQLHGVLRVPGGRLAEVAARLRQLGQVIEDTQGSEDVSDQLVDLDSRLANARATEKRLGEILRTRTGKLSDVLEVERELARVRLDIERLDAAKTNISRRVTYAAIDLTVSEERKAGLDGGPLSWNTRLRLATLDGLENALDSAAAVVLFVLRTGPTLLLWGCATAAIWLVARRISKA